MANVPGLKVSGSKNNWLVEQRIDLSDLLGKSDLPRTLKEQVGQAIIDSMVDRVLKEEKSVNGRGMKSYDPDYIASDEFKAYGKSASHVNMKLTGNMMNMLDIKEIDGDTVVIGWKDQENNAKAHGHMTGANNLPKREFFGANQKALDLIKADFIEDLPKDETKENAATLSALDILTRANTAPNTDSFGVDFFLGDNFDGN